MYNVPWKYSESNRKSDNHRKKKKELFSVSIMIAKNNESFNKKGSQKGNISLPEICDILL